MQKKLYKSCYQPVNAGGYKQPHMHTTQEDFKDGWWSQPKAPLTDGQGRKRSKPRNRGCVCVCVCAETFLACRFIKCQTAMVLANQDV